MLARKALPILVRQANAEQSIFYSDLASELGMSNPRNLNYVLGTIGNALKDLSKKWRTQIPPIQCLVINKQTGIPGEGIGWFVQDTEKFKRSSRKQKRLIIQQMLTDVFSFDSWDNVLQHFALKPTTNKPIRLTSAKTKGSYGGAGESEEHRKLKEYVARHPNLVGLSKDSLTTHTEYEFPSADAIDVLFQKRNEWIGIEVKSARSGIEDITRGLFQCIKYRALIEASQASEYHRPNARVVLVLEDPFPNELHWLKHILGVEVIDGVSPK